MDGSEVFESQVRSLKSFFSSDYSPSHSSHDNTFPQGQTTNPIFGKDCICLKFQSIFDFRYIFLGE